MPDTTGARTPRPISKARALRELQETADAHAACKAQLAKLEALRDRRIVRAVAAGVDKASAARVAKMTRQRAGQIVDKAAQA